jgi:adenosylcobinamide-phosphate synthase
MRRASDSMPPCAIEPGVCAIFSIITVILCAALLIEAVLGYPAVLFRAIGHPVTWFGALIGFLDRTFNVLSWSAFLRRAMGVAAVVVLVACTALPAWAIQRMALDVLPVPAAILVVALLASSLLASRSLWQHVAAVADALRDHGLAGGREKVSMIVGRNPQALDEAGVVRAAIESLAENFSDGVVAPALWCGLFGLPGIVFYKAVNTADSMIGHRTDRHGAFGWAAARLDDVINLPASRLSALLLVVAACLHGADGRGAIRAVWRDAGAHRSPNAGWPEAAMAGALGLRLAGPRIYGDVRVEDGWMGDGRAEATERDLRRALDLYRTACGLEIAMALGVAFFIARG